MRHAPVVTVSVVTYVLLVLMLNTALPVPPPVPLRCRLHCSYGAISAAPPLPPPLPLKCLLHRPPAAASLDPSLPRVVSLQNAYSLTCRTFDSGGLAEACHLEGVGLLAYSPLAMGLLTVGRESMQV